MERMRLHSSLFRSKKNILKEVLQEAERRSSEAPREFQEREDLPVRSARSVHEEHSESSSYGYVHSSISPESHHFFSESFMKREREGVSLSDALPRVRSPLGEGSSSQEESCSETFMRFQEKEEDMGIPPSREVQSLRSPIEDEACSLSE